VQDACYQVFGFHRDGHVIRKGLRVHADFALGGFDVIGFKWRLADEHGVDHYAQTPSVDFKGVPGLAFEDLGGDLVGGPADSALLLPVELEFGCQAEVAELEFHLVCEEQVSKLEVAVDDLVALQVAHARNDLHDVALHLDFGQALASAHLLVDGLVGAQFKQDLDLLRVFEEVVEAHDVRVV